MAEVPALDRPNIITRMTAPAGGNAEAVFGGFIVPSAFGTDSQHKKRGIVPINPWPTFAQHLVLKETAPALGETGAAGLGIS
jgi:hypothetical protein